MKRRNVTNFSDKFITVKPKQPDLLPVRGMKDSNGKWFCMLESSRNYIIDQVKKKNYTIKQLNEIYDLGRHTINQWISKKSNQEAIREFIKQHSGE